MYEDSSVDLTDNVAPTSVTIPLRLRNPGESEEWHLRRLSPDGKVMSQSALHLIIITQASAGHAHFGGMLTGSFAFHLDGEISMQSMNIVHTFLDWVMCSPALPAYADCTTVHTQGKGFEVISF